jgi:hypothetical protein
MLFEYLKDIFIVKKGNLPLDDYIPFLINRWISFVGNSAISINDSVNALTNLDKSQHYKLLIKCYPKQKKQPFIKYIKKIKEEQTQKDDNTLLLAHNMELSKREVKQLLELKQQLT